MERFLYLHFLIKNYTVNQLKNKVHQLYKKFLEKIQKIRKEKLLNFFVVYLSFTLNKKFYHFFFKKKQTKTFKEFNKKLNVLYKIIEYLKNLYRFTDNDKMVLNILKKIKDIKDRWEHSRNIFHTKVEYVFKTYRFHLENFLKYLNFNKNFQSLEYEHKIQKLKIISRVKELIKETKLPKNLNELYHLHHLRKKKCRKTNYLLISKKIIEKINNLNDFFFKFFSFKIKKLYSKFLFDKYDFLEKKLLKYMEIISNEILKNRKNILTLFLDKKAFLKKKSLDHKNVNFFMNKFNYTNNIIEFLEILEKII